VISIRFSRLVMKSVHVLKYTKKRFSVIRYLGVFPYLLMNCHRGRDPTLSEFFQFLGRLLYFSNLSLNPTNKVEIFTLPDILSRTIPRLKFRQPDNFWMTVINYLRSLDHLSSDHPSWSPLTQLSKTPLSCSPRFCRQQINKVFYNFQLNVRGFLAASN